MLLTGCLLATFAAPTPRLSELGSGVISSSEETIKLGGFNVEILLRVSPRKPGRLTPLKGRLFLEKKYAWEHRGFM